LLALLHSRQRTHSPHKSLGEPPAAEPIGSWGALSEEVSRGVRAAPARLGAMALRAPKTLASRLGELGLTELPQPLVEVIDFPGLGSRLHPETAAMQPPYHGRGLGQQGEVVHLCRSAGRTFQVRVWS
jgi:hypothetical protein